MTRTPWILMGLLLGCRSEAPTVPAAAEQPLWKLTFGSAFKSDKDVKGMVFVGIEKTAPGVGTVVKRHIHFEGDRIGWWEETPDARPVSVHPVKLRDGSTAEVDFDVGATLLKVMPVHKVIEVHRCKPVYSGETGDRLYCETVIDKRGWEGYEISYRDAWAIHRVLVPDPARLDQLCPRHQ